jgi:flagellar motor switch protein FliM
LAEELWNTESELEAVLDEQTMRLSDIIDLKPGSRILLSASPDAPVLLRCGTVSLFEGKVGRRKNHVAVRIDQELSRKQGSER